MHRNLEVYNIIYIYMSRDIIKGSGMMTKIINLVYCYGHIEGYHYIIDICPICLSIPAMIVNDLFRQK